MCASRIFSDVMQVFGYENKGNPSLFDDWWASSSSFGSLANLWLTRFQSCWPTTVSQKDKNLLR